VGVDEWHIDFPQLRGRLVEIKEKFAADYEEIGSVLTKLLKRYYSQGKPLYLKIYKIYSSKISENNFYSPDLNENPCTYKTDFSMFINAEGKYLLCPSIPSQDITISNISSSFDNAVNLKGSLEFQKMTFKDLKDCIGCRYFGLCLGGCRGEAKVLSDSFNGPDLNACSLMTIAEKVIYPSLPEKDSQTYLSRINKNKKVPRFIKNLDDMRNETQKRYSSIN
jgi:radical SAM protein with 4Fe4S-binding SPASM domain